MYTFLDKSDRRLCLRPEFTSSILRAVLNDKKMAAHTSSVYYVPSGLSVSIVVWKRISLRKTATWTIS